MLSAVSAYTDRNRVVLVNRNKTGELTYQNLKAEYTAFVHEMPKAKGTICRAERASKGWIKLWWKSYQDRKAWREANPGIKLWEADVNPVRRVMSDLDIEVVRPARAYFDIETDSRKTPAQAVEGLARILCWAMVGEDGWAEGRVLEEDTDDAERELLQKWVKYAEAYDQICGWYLDDFDYPVMEARCKALGVDLPRRLLWMDQLAAFKKLNLQVASGAEEKTSFALDHVARTLLGEGKDDFDRSDTWGAWANGEREALLRYCIKDADLLRRIESKKSYLELNWTICKACNIFPNSHSLKPSTQFDGWMLRKARKEGKHLPSKPLESTKGEDFEGAYVMAPVTSGILKDVRVVDFSSLYPSIIRSWNISPETKIGPSPHATRKELVASGNCVAPKTGIEFRQDVEGEFPRALTELIQLRTHWKKEKQRCVVAGDAEGAKVADLFQNGYKVLVNSGYGLMGNVHWRFFDKECAEAVTTSGQWLVQTLSAEGEKFGYRTIAIDTDGIFFDRATHEQMEEFAKNANEVWLPNWLEEYNCKTKVIGVEYQEAFERLIIPVDDKGKPVSKRYVGKLSHYDGKPVQKEHIIVKGLEVKRGDSSRLARRMQQEVIDLLLAGEERPQFFEQLVARWRAEVTTGKVELADISLSKSLKELGAYKTDTLPAHVRVALELKARGEDVGAGDRVEFFVVDADQSPMLVAPISDFKGEFDRRHVWNSVYPPTMRLLGGAIPTMNWSHHLIPKQKKKDKPLKGQLGLFG